MLLGGVTYQLARCCRCWGRQLEKGVEKMDVTEEVYIGESHKSIVTRSHLSSDPHTKQVHSALSGDCVDHQGEGMGGGDNKPVSRLGYLGTVQ